VIAEQLDEIVRCIVARFDPDRIILFGSHARHAASQDSDIDVLVVMPVTGTKREKRIEVRCALRSIHIPKDIIVVTPQDFENRRDIPGTIVRAALREGEELYVRAG